MPKNEQGRSILEMIAVLIIIVIILIVGLWGFKKATTTTRVNTMTKDLSAAVTQRRYINAQGGSLKLKTLEGKVGATFMKIENRISEGDFFVQMALSDPAVCNEMKQYNVFKPKAIGSKTDEGNFYTTSNFLEIDCTNIKELTFYFDNSASEEEEGNVLHNVCEKVSFESGCKANRYDSNGCLIYKHQDCATGEYCNSTTGYCCPNDDVVPEDLLCYTQTTDTTNPNCPVNKYTYKGDGAEVEDCGVCQGNHITRSTVTPPTCYQCNTSTWKWELINESKTHVCGTECCENGCNPANELECAECDNDEDCEGIKICDFTTKTCVCPGESTLCGTECCENGCNPANELECAECNNDEDCEGIKICDETTKTCICPGEATTCGTECCENGCNPENELECAECDNDEDCEGIKICDSTTKTCVCPEESTLCGTECCENGCNPENELACAECDNDEDCEGIKICGPTTKTCVCPEEATTCGTECCPKGSKCLPDNTCSFEGMECTYDDIDSCGGAGSGFYCNTCDDIFGDIGQCLPIGDGVDIQVKNFGKLKVSKFPLNWNSAYSWCQSQGQKLVDFKKNNRLECYENGTEYDYSWTTRFCCSKESSQSNCDAKKTWCYMEPEKLSQPMNDFFKFVSDISNEYIVLWGINKAGENRLSIELYYPQSDCANIYNTHMSGGHVVYQTYWVGCPGSGTDDFHAACE